jgi:diguanylate cyclase (GGDEF)-like protein
MVLQKRANIDLESQITARTQDLEEANHRLEELSGTDFLTGLPNRRRFQERYEAVCREDQGVSSPMTVLLLDVDHFKAYNDRLGHLAGDKCLQEVAKNLQGCLRRGTDFCARFGGEEFVLCLLHTPESETAAVADRVRERMEALAIPHPGSSTSAVVTISLGIAQGTIGMDMESLLRRADASLYLAKEGGRNRVGPPG